MLFISLLCNCIRLEVHGADFSQMEAPKPRKIAPAVRNAGKRRAGKPSLWVKMPLPAPASPQAPLSPSLASGSAPEVKVEDNAEAKGGSSSGNGKKRSAPHVDNDDDSDLFAPSSSRGPAPKKQRLQSSAAKPRATPRVKAAAKSGHDDRPEPRGPPDVWAEVLVILSFDRIVSEKLTLPQARQSLCEALPYYQAFQSGAYSWGSKGGKGGYVYGFLLDNDNDERGYMDEKVVITRT